MRNGHWNGGPSTWNDPEAAALKQQEFWSISPVKGKGFQAVQGEILLRQSINPARQKQDSWRDDCRRTCRLAGFCAQIGRDISINAVMIWANACKTPLLKRFGIKSKRF